MMSTRALEPAAVVSNGLVFPESPRWHAGKLWLSDMHAHRVLQLDAGGTVHMYAALDDKPSGIGFLADGTPVVVAMRRRVILRLEQAGPVVHADLSGVTGLAALNDMVSAPDGTLYVGGRLDPDAALDGSSGAVFHISPSGELVGSCGGVRGPNGMVITPGRETLIVSELRGNALSAFDIAADGSLGGQRVFADLGERSPDGICADAEGAVWAGCPFSGEFIRVHEGGRVSDRIPLDEDCLWTVACMLGGEARDRLYLVCAHETWENVRACDSFEADLRSTARGLVLSVEVEVPGAGWPD